jgi:hypothetical protein
VHCWPLATLVETERKWNVIHEAGKAMLGAQTSLQFMTPELGVLSRTYQRSNVLKNKVR